MRLIAREPYWTSSFSTAATLRRPLDCSASSLGNQDIKPKRIMTDKLGSYGSALKLLGLKHLQDVGGRKNNRAEFSHVSSRRRDRKAQTFRSIHRAPKLLSANGQIYTLFNHRRHLTSRPTLRKFRTQSRNEWDLITAQACA